jgi:alkylation response protein AidB-like acyl-CoA dehydrogenase
VTASGNPLGDEMDFELTAQQKAVKARAAAFVEEVCRPLEDAWPLDDYEADPELVMHVARKFREHGLRGLSVPEAAGGSGAGALAKCLVYEELESSHVVHGALATWAGLMEPHPALYRAPQWQQQKYLRPLLDEDRFFHLNISEPGAGSDAAGITTTAVRRGDGYESRRVDRAGVRHDRHRISRPVLRLRVRRLHGSGGEPARRRRRGLRAHDGPA